MTILDAKLAIESSITTGQSEPTDKPQHLPLDSIQAFPDVFQPRGPAGNASKAHVRELARVPKGGHTLDPITVFWVGTGWAVIDGHHRLHAYHFAKWRRDIPVSIFQGSLDDAMYYAGKMNSGDKLPMSLAEKRALAWRLTTCTDLSKEKVRLASGMSDGFLSHMRRVHKKLLKEMDISRSEAAGMSWWDAQQKYGGTTKEIEGVELDAWLEEQAQEMANKIIKAIGKRGQEQHEVLARALEIYDGRLPDSLREYWDTSKGAVEGLEEENPEF